MLYNLKKTIYKKAEQMFGRDNQLNMVVEECAELIHAICKFRRNASAENLKHLCEEIADAEIMIEQLKLMLDKDLLIDSIKDKKLKKLITLLKIKL